MAWKFYNIGKANEEITRLESENATLKTQVEEAAKTPEDVQKHAESVAKENSELVTALNSARVKVTELEMSNGQLTDAATKHAEALKAKDVEVEKLAAAKALEITQKQGQPPLPMGAPATNPATTAAPKTELKGRDRLIAAQKAQATK